MEDLYHRLKRKQEILFGILNKVVSCEVMRDLVFMYKSDLDPVLGR